MHDDRGGLAGLNARKHMTIASYWRVVVASAVAPETRFNLVINYITCQTRPLFNQLDLVTFG
jgi:hypothetical protein